LTNFASFNILCILLFTNISFNRYPFLESVFIFVIFPSLQEGYTGLMCAAEGGHSDTVRLLIERNANLELTTNAGGFTALLLACKNGHNAVIRILVNAGANVETSDLAYGCSSLLWSVQAASVESVRLLCERGADLEARSRFGMTALMYAVEAGQVEKAKVLLAFGADPKAKDSRGNTPISKAKAKGFKTIQSVLEQGLDDAEAESLRQPPQPKRENSMKRTSSRRN
jgi:ankyrin repeat protein